MRARADEESRRLREAVDAEEQRQQADVQKRLAARRQKMERKRDRKRQSMLMRAAGRIAGL